MEIFGMIILLIPVLILVLSPLILFLVKKRRRKRTVQSQQNRPEALQAPVQTPVYRKETGRKPARINFVNNPSSSKPVSAGGPFRKIDKLPRLKQAVVWAEILGPPRSLKEK